MDAVMIRVKPYKGKYCSRKVANRVNDFLMSLPMPNDEKLKNEAEEFKKIMLERRKASNQVI